MERCIDGVWYEVVFDGEHHGADADLLHPVTCRSIGPTTYRPIEGYSPKSKRPPYQRRFKACPQCQISSISQRQKICLRCRWAKSQLTASELRKKARRHTRKWYPTLDPCEVCGVRENIHRHHRDDDPFNNRPENIGYLCELHHIVLHRFAMPTRNEYINNQIAIRRAYFAR